MDHATDFSIPPIEPRPGVLKTIGILNVVFSSLLLVCGGCYGIQIIYMMSAASVMRPMMEVQQVQIDAQLKADRREEIEALQAQEDSAESEEEKAVLGAQRQNLESLPEPAAPDFTKMWTGFQGGRFLGYSIADLLTGLLLNVLMLIAGIGLMKMKEWGRKLGLWVAGLKIVRLVLFQGFFIIAVVPGIAKGLGEAMEEMGRSMPQAGRPGAAPPPQMGQAVAAMYGVMFTVGAAGAAVFGSIYPAVCLWYLSRSGVKAACQLIPVEPFYDRPPS